MPWEKKGGGGPWGGWGGGSGGGGPWGRGGGSGGGPRPPDFEDFIKRGQDSFRSILPGGGGGLGKSAYLLIGLGVIIVWLLTGLYRVQTNEQGVVLRFGKWVETRSEEHTSELQSLMRSSYAVFCLKKKNHKNYHEPT